MNSYHKGIFNNHNLRTFSNVEKCAIHNQQPPQQHLLFHVLYKQKLFASTKYVKLFRFLEAKVQQCCPNLVAVSEARNCLLHSLD